MSTPTDATRLPSGRTGSRRVVARVASPTPKSSMRTRVAGASRFALLGLLVIFIVAFSIIEPSTFATVGNAKTVLSTQSVLALVSLAALLTLVIGEFDLSLGAQMGLAALLLPGLTAKSSVPIPVAIALSIAATALVGLINGLLVAKAKVNSFIATIGTAALIGAVVLAYSGGTVIFQGVPDRSSTFPNSHPWASPDPLSMSLSPRSRCGCSYVAPPSADI